MDTLIPVNVVVGDRTYRVRIDKKDEEIVRKTVKTINDKIIEFKTNFAGKDMQDYISMVILWYATTAAGGTNMPAGLSEKMTSMEAILDRVLSK